MRTFYRIGSVEFEISGKGDLAPAVAAAQKRASLFEREFGVTALFRRPVRREGRRVA